MNQQKSLYQLCINYISQNISKVESLKCFPSLIAEDLFKSCLKVGSLDHNNEQTVDALKVFVNAYNTEFVTSLKCNSLIFLSEYEEVFEVLCLSLTKLDLSGCEIGDNSLLLPVLHKSNYLKILNLRDNRLTDDGLRKLLPIPFKGFSSLTDINVCGNEITIRSVIRLLRLTSLKSLFISLPRNPDKYQEYIKTIHSKGYVKGDEKDGRIFESIINDGWGVPIMLRWEDKLKEYQEQKKKKYFDLKRSKFYVSTKNVTHSVTSTQSKNMDMIFKRSESTKSGSKRPLEENNDKTPQKKRKTFQDYQAELFDVELLNAYR